MFGNMSSSIGQGYHHLHKRVIRGVIEDQSKHNSFGNTLFPIQGCLKRSTNKGSFLLPKFRGKSLKLVRSRFPMGSPVIFLPCAVLATDTASEVDESFVFGGI